MFCTNCGKEVNPNSNFCQSCGTRLKNEPNPNASHNQNPNLGQIRIISQADPTFRVVCEYCCCEFEYHLSNLGYRAWYPSGFVYCPKCQRPLRHKLEYQVK